MLIWLLKCPIPPESENLEHRVAHVQIPHQEQAAYKDEWKKVVFSIFTFEQESLCWFIHHFNDVQSIFKDPELTRSWWLMR